MKQLISSLFFTIILYSLSKLNTNAQESIHSSARYCYGNPITGNFLTRDNFTNNVYSLLSLLGSYDQSSQSSHTNTPRYFYNTSVGEFPPRAYGSYFCRGDLKPRLCDNCVSDITKFLSGVDITNSDCYGDGVYYSGLHCIVHFANTSTFSVYQQGRPLESNSIGVKVANYELYNGTLSSTMQGLVREATFGNWTLPNFETKVVKVNGTDQKIFVLVQCTPDISAMNCSTCLQELYADLPKCCNGTQGGYVAYGNCLMKYNNESFFGSAHRGFLPTNWHVTMALIMTMYFVFM